jgi:type II secretory pathway component PulM
LIARVSESALSHGLTLKRFEPSTDGRLTIWLAEAEFERLLLWLEQLETALGLQTRRVSIVQTGTPGLVDAQIVVSQ